MLKRHSENVGESPNIKVFGIGGAGINAVSYMIEQDMTSIDFIAIDTDVVALKASKAHVKFGIGKGINGFCQIHSSVIRQHCDQYRPQLRSMSQDTEVIVLCVGLGGGTGSGASSVIAEEAAASNALVIAFVTLPFGFEGKARMEAAIEGLYALKKHADIVVVIPNDLLAELFDDTATLSGVFAFSDKVLYKGVCAVINIFAQDICLDFFDIRKLLKGQEYAALGIGTAEGVNRTIRAVEDVLTSPLLGTTDISHAQCIMICVYGGSDMLMGEVSHLYEVIKSNTGTDAKIFTGFEIDDKEHPEIEVIIILAGV